MGEEAVAIIGLGCRFPKAKNPEEFWQLLRNGTDAITEVPNTRWNIDSLYDLKSAVTDNSRWGGFLEDVDQFDPQFFGISPREAMTMDPQQRLVMEVAYEALEDAGLPLEKLKGTQTGVFVGISSFDYNELLVEKTAPGDSYGSTGKSLSITANRLSYTFDLYGPSMAVDTACSSSLMAIHLACRSLRDKEATMAIAGGVHLLLSPITSINLSKAGFLSPDGRCKTFDAAANGYVRSEGCGIVILKPLSQAVADQDDIYAVIRGSAVNQDGRSNGLTAPNPRSQEMLLQSAYENAGISPGQVQYVEAHGTGTKLGDPIEIKSLGKILARDRAPDNPCAVGSVKTNIGHLEAASGIAGLIKVALSIKHQEIPPSLNFQNPNPYIPFDELSIRVQQKLTPWENWGEGAIAGVSSFGFGGTNAHVVISYPLLGNSRGEGPFARTNQERNSHLLTISAKTPEALQDFARSYEEFLGDDPTAAIADICYNATIKRSHFSHRLALVGSSKEELKNQLNNFIPDELTPNIAIGQVKRRKQPKIVFLFTGQGSQYVDMGRQLYESQPVFRQTLEKCQEILFPYLENPLLEIIYPDETSNNSLNQTAYTQPALFALEYALAMLWKSWGILPNAVMGHSLGEYVAACIAGVFSLEDALRLVAARGKIMQALPANGEMVAVFANKDTVENILADYKEQVNIACINAPQNIVISGLSSAIQKVLEQLKKQGIEAKKLQVSHAFHSWLMQPMIDKFKQVASNINYAQPKIPIISNLTGKQIQDFTPDYWCEHILNPIQFVAGMETLNKSGYEIFLEIGPHTVLLGMGRQCLSSGKQVWLTSLKRKENDWNLLLESLAKLYVRGAAIDWQNFYQEYSGKKVKLPTYPFQRQRYWFEENKPNVTHISNKISHPLLQKKIRSDNKNEIIYESLLDIELISWLKDHQIYGQVTVPATAYLEIALSGLKEQFDTGCYQLENVEFLKLLVIEDNRSQLIQLRIKAEIEQNFSFELWSQEKKAETWQLHSRGNIRIVQASVELASISQDKILSQCPIEITRESHYQNLRIKGIEYGSGFQGIRQLWRSEVTAIAHVQLPENIQLEANQYCLHPALFDASLQVMATLTNSSEQDAFLPISVEDYQIFRFSSSKLWSYAVVQSDKKVNQDLFSANFYLFDDNGQVIAKVKNFVVKRVSKKALQHLNQKPVEDLLYKIHWDLQPNLKIIEKTQQSPGIWVIFSDSDHVSQILASLLQKRGETCIFVFPGKTYQVDNNSYYINPSSSEDYRRLFKEILAINSLPLKGIIHLWSLDFKTTESITIADLKEAETLGCATVLNLVQTLNEIPDLFARLWLVTSNAQSVNSPRTNSVAVTQAPLWGMGKVIGLEHPELWGGLIDLDLPITEQQIEMLLAEIWHPEQSDEIALRKGNKRYIPHLVPYRPKQKLTSPIVKTEGTYFITGGLGSLGLKVAQWLAKQGVKNLVLLSRQGITGNNQAKIKNLEELGTKVKVIAADVGNFPRMSEIFAQEFPEQDSLQGIIHAAGVIEDGILQNQTWTKFRSVLAPKVMGAWNLHQCTKNINLDFFILFSSVASVVGSPGQGNYAAANAFMDAFAHHRHCLKMPALSINWGPWTGEGMADSQQQQLNKMGVQSLTEDRALAALESILRLDEPQITVAQVDWKIFKPIYEVQPRRSLLKEINVKASQDIQEQVSQSQEIVQQIQQVSRSQGLGLCLDFAQTRSRKVLGLEPNFRLDIQQPLQELGFDSMMAVELRNGIANSLGVDLPITTFLDGCTVSNLANLIFEKITTNTFIDNSLLTIKPISRESRNFLLSPFQESFWFLEQLASQDSHYNANVPLVLSLTGDLDLGILTNTIREIVQRHEILRTNFPIVDGKQVMVIRQSFPIELPLIDLSHLSGQELEKAIEQQKNLELNHRFSLVNEPLFRIRLWQLDEQEYLFIFTLHHLISDVWSLGLLGQEIATVYESFTQGQLSSLNDLPIQYVDFAQWQQDMMQDNAFVADISYWQNKLANAREKLDLPIEKEPTSFLTFSYVNQSIILDLELVNGVKDISNAHGVTSFITLLTVLKILLFKWTEQEDIVIGTVSANRGHKDIENLIGCFVNFLPLRSQLLANKSGIVFLKEVQETVLESYEHQALPFIKIVENAQANTKNSKNPIYNVAFLLQNFRFTKTFTMSNNLTASLVPIDPQATPLDLRFVAIPDEDQGKIELECEYNPDLFQDQTIKNLLTAYNQILKEFVANPQKQLQEFTILDKLIIKTKKTDTIDFDNNFTEMIPQIVEIFSDVLNIEKFNIDDNIFALGGDLSEVNKILDQLKEMFAIELSTVNLNQNLTVVSLAKIIGEELTKQAQIVEMLEQLSDEEVEKLLQEDSNVSF